MLAFIIIELFIAFWLIKFLGKMVLYVIEVLFVAYVVMQFLEIFPYLLVIAAIASIALYFYRKKHPKVTAAGIQEPEPQPHEPIAKVADDLIMLKDLLDKGILT